MLRDGSRWVRRMLAYGFTLTRAPSMPLARWGELRPVLEDMPC